MAKCRAVYETFPGWQSPTDKIRTWKALPLNARRYAKALARLTGTKLSHPFGRPGPIADHHPVNAAAWPSA
ncbi:MAG: hypothetical protein CM1200mP29_08970 [Verrucomicrobiota bacterium]|nr:MAG: hypothetical protein CM1200mP29_08970 [Verrucomicrobiota bacterium]